MTEITHTPGPARFEKLADYKQICLTHDGNMFLSIPAVDFPLFLKYVEVPHVCSDPNCPGNINRLKLEAFDEILQNTIPSRRLRMLADWLDLKHHDYPSNEIQADLRKMADAIALAEAAKEGKRYD